MIKRICDRCGKEIKSANYWTISIYEKEDNLGQVSLKGAMNNLIQNTNPQKEYCYECIQEIQSIINNYNKKEDK